MKISIKILAIALFLIIPLSVSAKTFDKNLYFGITNDSDVQMLQEFLTDQGAYSGPITGNFFSLTLAAVKKYQSQNNIAPAAGFFGPITRTKANVILSSQTQNSDAQAIAETGTIAPPTTQNTTTDSNQQLMLNLQSQISALLQQITQMQQQSTQTPSQPVSQIPAQTTQTTQSQPTQTNSNTTTSSIRISIGGNNGAIGNETSRTLYVGQTNQLAPTMVYPADSTYSGFIWSSSDPTVASVSSGGLVTALKAGLAIITVTTTVNNSVTVSATDAITVIQSQTQSTQTQNTDLQITLTGVWAHILYSAKITWQTNMPSMSKVSIWTDNVSIKIVPSESGLSSQHIANITGLLPGKNYSFEIEAIANNVSVKKSWELLTAAIPSLSTDWISLNTNSLKATSAEFVANIGNSYQIPFNASWEFYVNGQGVSPNYYGNRSAQLVVNNLTPETEYPYRLVYKEPGREDFVKTGMFRTSAIDTTTQIPFDQNKLSITIPGAESTGSVMRINYDRKSPLNNTNYKMVIHISGGPVDIRTSPEDSKENIVQEGNNLLLQPLTPNTIYEYKLNITATDIDGRIINLEKPFSFRTPKGNLGDNYWYSYLEPQTLLVQDNIPLGSIICKTRIYTKYYTTDWPWGEYKIMNSTTDSCP